MKKENSISIYDLIRKGDKCTFEDLPRKYYPALCELSMAITHSHETAEEIVDDLFFSLWDHRATFFIDLKCFESILKDTKNQNELYKFSKNCFIT
ncbi:hypothetical protein PRBRB14_04670 [Hallella multisaccharivorax DSM 17128]|uniref:RNA polymerase ECF-type sigma factor n=1 Tax=Hallella multisaccharivorax DSM 17128 TaxID=688246 RepID=F8N5T0_9BACT|nr:RNA polymerase ECF-type sigma factor [Hallella multisaccharivorax DSM 17128]GJG29588.1 hypothetical protein PRBRB14_04670 [Hallella multisaccharivorax DSM 17128]